jgi:aspartokinase/homoserine dehydrogenase 1
MHIMKFGGTSVSTPERIRHVMHLVKERYQVDPHLAVVVSAFSGVTDQLNIISQQAAKGESHYLKALSQLHERHLEAAESLIPPTRFPQASHQIESYLKDLNDALHGVFLIKELSKRSLDFIMSFGEILSAYIISEALKSLIPITEFLDARQLILTDRNFGAGRVNYPKTYAMIGSCFASHHSMPVITGFIAATEEKETITLGRGGSDFTAAIIGAALNAEEIEIWTDVDGVMTADPRKVQQAFTIPSMNYKEALEMSHFGAKVLYPPTIVPALQKNIPIRIKNSFSPQAHGTLICNQPIIHGSMISGITSIDNIALLRFEGSGIVGVPGMAMRLFGALAKKEINVILISQGSSEHSICFAILPQSVSLAKEVIEAEFALEMHLGLIEPVIVELGLSVIAAVGENMRKIPGISGRLFGALGRNGINVVAMMQGSSEYNITIVVSRQDEARALNVIHEEFFVNSMTTLNLFLVGTGLIGKSLLQIMKREIARIRQEEKIDIHLVGLADSKKALFDHEGLALDGCLELLPRSPEKMELAAFMAKMKGMNLINTIFVDCTSSQEVADSYPEILKSSISIVTPNKKANSGSYADYKKLMELSRRRGRKFYYETNVGGGLPIISTIIDLRRSGDKILKVEGILSGTLSFLFNNFKEGVAFSQILREAQRRGYTEPDPREDLNGKDVARKLLILARESGNQLELDQIAIEPLLPQEYYDCSSLDQFYQKLADYDALMEEKRQEAQSQGKVLRYVAKLDQGKASLSLQAVGPQHPFYHLTGSENSVAITTERYMETPLVIRGRGAGADVTGGEVFADIVRIGFNL